MSFIFYLFLTLFLVLAGVLSLVILVQESKSLGLGASFGGDAGESLFGTSTAAVLKKFTGWLAVFFMALCIILSFWTGSIGRNRTSSIPLTIEKSE